MEAKRRGVCRACPEPIEAGQRITEEGGGWVHSLCATEMPSHLRAVSRCGNHTTAQHTPQDQDYINAWGSALCKEAERGNTEMYEHLLSMRPVCPISRAEEDAR